MFRLIPTNPGWEFSVSAYNWERSWPAAKEAGAYANFRPCVAHVFFPFPIRSAWHEFAQWCPMPRERMMNAGHHLSSRGTLDHARKHFTVEICERPTREAALGPEPCRQIGTAAAPDPFGSKALVSRNEMERGPLAHSRPTRRPMTNGRLAQRKYEELRSPSIGVALPPLRTLTSSCGPRPKRRYENLFLELGAHRPRAHLRGGRPTDPHRSICIFFSPISAKTPLNISR